jgi:hypothetical protein
MARQRLATTISITVLAFTLGLHWVVLQSIAWLHDHSYTNVTFVYAAEKKALNAKTTCTLCQLVDAGKKAEQDESPAMIVVHELISLTPELPPIVSCPDTFYHEIGSLAALFLRANAPHTPPPQSCV